MYTETPSSVGHDGLAVPASMLLRNQSSKPWIVQKFGGTSVGKFAKQIADEIVKPSLADNRIAAVCSARSTGTKLEGTTNRLLRAAREAERQDSKQYEDIVNCICQDHIQAAHNNIQSTKILAHLCAEVSQECRDLIAFLAAAQTVGEISSRSLDHIVSIGENLSCRFVAALLQDQGIDAKFVDLANLCSLKDAPEVLDHAYYQGLAATLQRTLGRCGDAVPVVTGFFGTIPGGLLNQIGRGYTDLCAALIAVGLKAEELQIWKEVDGIFTADPRKVPTAKLLSTISPVEAAEMTFYGSEVIHPFTMEQVIQARIPIRIKNVMNPRALGTVIAPDPPSHPLAAYKRDRNLFRHPSSSTLYPNHRPRRPTAVTIKRKILVLNVHSNKRSLSHGFFAKIFSVLDKWRLSVDLISTSEVHVSMALHSESALVSGGGWDEKRIVDKDLHGAIEELRQFGTVDLIDGMAILSLVGKQMRNMVGIAGKMFSTLGENNVNIEMISQGASEINISCVIEERDADRAMNILHTNLFTFLE